MRLEDKTIIVSGAAHGIGRAYSERLAAEGANVALLDIDGARNDEDAACIRAKKASPSRSRPTSVTSRPSSGRLRGPRKSSAASTGS
jgi:NAD(P)-dependent dehydrogenase (short-subunit alcohol dehydrogenase family)